MMFKYKSVYFFLFLLIQVGCTGITNNNGYMPVVEDIEKLSIKKTTAGKVRSVLGEPALIIGKDKPVFVYFSQASRKLFFFEKQIIKRNLLVLRFDKRKRLSKIENFSLADGKDFKLSNSDTDLSDKEKSLIANLFSNIGIGGVRLN